MSFVSILKILARVFQNTDLTAGTYNSYRLPNIEGPFGAEEFFHFDSQEQVVLIGCAQLLIGMIPISQYYFSSFTDYWRRFCLLHPEEQPEPQRKNIIH